MAVKNHNYDKLNMNARSIYLTVSFLILSMSCSDKYYTTEIITNNQTAYIDVVKYEDFSVGIGGHVTGEPFPIVSQLLINDQSIDFNTDVYNNGFSTRIDSLSDSAKCEIISSYGSFIGYAHFPVRFDSVLYSHVDSIPLGEDLTMSFHGGRYDFIHMVIEYGYGDIDNFVDILIDTTFTDSIFVLPASVYPYPGILRLLDFEMVNGVLPKPDQPGNLILGQGYIWTSIESNPRFTFIIK